MALQCSVSLETLIEVFQENTRMGDRSATRYFVSLLHRQHEYKELEAVLRSHVEDRIEDMSITMTLDAVNEQQCSPDDKIEKRVEWLAELLLCSNRDFRSTMKIIEEESAVEQS